MYCLVWFESGDNQIFLPTATLEQLGDASFFVIMIAKSIKEISRRRHFVMMSTAWYHIDLLLPHLYVAGIH